MPFQDIDNDDVIVENLVLDNLYIQNFIISDFGNLINVKQVAVDYAFDPNSVQIRV